MASMKRYLKKIALGAAVCLLTISTSMSDDIDVYVAPPEAALPGHTYVILTLDLRPNVLASSVCTGTNDAGENECWDLLSHSEVNMEATLEDGHVSYLELLSAALKKVLRTQIGHPKIKVALMVPHDDSGGTNKEGECLGFQTDGKVTCSNGAYVLSAFRSTGDDSSTPDVNEKEELDYFFRKLDSIPLKDGENWGHKYQNKELFFEMYRYLTGGHVFNGENGADDYGTKGEKDPNGNPWNIDDPEDTESVYPGDDEATDPVAELMWDIEAVNSSTKTYQKALDVADHCTTIFSVNLTDGTASDDDDSDPYIETDLGITLDGSNHSSRLQLLNYLANTDLDATLAGTQNISSYFLATESGNSGDVGGRASDWAQAGGTESALLATTDPEELENLLAGLFNEILSVSTTFVAASVPANVFNRAETLNEVFLAVFEPTKDENANPSEPFWVGNVKKLTTKMIDEAVEGTCEDTDGDGFEECETEERRILVDVLKAESAVEQEDSAINPGDGRIRAGALTYWTRTGPNNEYLPPPPPSPPGEEDIANDFEVGTDGREVARGGAGQVKPGFLGIGTPGEPGAENDSNPTTISGPRKIFTETDDDDTTTDDADGDDTTTNDLVNLDADSGFNTAVNLLTDGRSYPGSSLTYGEFLFQTVMSDCADCASSYGDETNSSHRDTAEARVNNLIRFARGYAFTDIDTPTSDDNKTDNVDESKRPWWQADPLHSRPLAVNYGARGNYTADDPDIRVIVSGNDGMVQMIRDGRTPSNLNSDGSPEDGVEAWSFLPREFVPLQKRLLEGTNGVYDPGVPVTDDDIVGDDPRIPLHPYAMDGAPTALVIDNNLDGTINAAAPSDANPLDGDDRVYLFMGQRRGGKRYYALDISDPDSPKLLWILGKDDAGFSQLGQSWSLMRAGIMQIDEDGDDTTAPNRRPVLIFSGGYDGDDGGDGAGDLGKDSRVKTAGPDNTLGTDDDEIVGTNDDEGNALFIVNALTGDLIWKAIDTADGDVPSYDPNILAYKKPDLNDSVAATPTALDTSGDGFIDRVYFPDTGGNVWRMDAASAKRSDWTVTKLFAAGRHAPEQANNANDRRFFNAPDVVFSEDQSGKFDAVILASGDRAHPLGEEVENWIYMIKDRDTQSGAPPSTTLTHNDLADLTDNCLQGVDFESAEPFAGCTDDLAESKLVNGWKIKLRQCEAGGVNDKCGEKSLASPLTIEGTIFLTTYLPLLEDQTGQEVPDTCGPKEGSGLFYALDLQTAGGVLEFDPSNSAGGVVTPDRFDKLASPGIPPEVVAISPGEVLRPDLKIQKTKGRKSSKTFWYERRFN